MPICLTLDTQVDALAESIAFLDMPNPITERTAIMAMTIKSSIRVKPREPILGRLGLGWVLGFFMIFRRYCIYRSSSSIDAISYYLMSLLRTKIKRLSICQVVSRKLFCSFIFRADSKYWMS